MFAYFEMKQKEVINGNYIKKIPVEILFKIKI